MERRGERSQRVISRKDAIEFQLMILRCRRGDSGGLEAMVERWERPLFYYIRRLVETEEDAWDVLQEVWYSVMKGIGKLREPAALPAWLYRIARNTAFSHLRRKPPFEPLDGRECGAEAGEPVPEAFFEEMQAEAVHRALESLRLPHREVLTLRFLEGFSLAEIAEVTGAPEGTVKSRLFHAKRALREAVETGGRRP